MYFTSEDETDPSTIFETLTFLSTRFCEDCSFVADASFLTDSSDVPEQLAFCTDLFVR